MTLSLRARQGLAITASIAAAVAALTGCAGSHTTAAGSSTTANHPAGKAASAPAPARTNTTSPSSSKPTSPTAKVNPVVQQSKPPTAADLGLGRTGTRDQVMWSHVGSGWKLLQPLEGPDLYLYDPDGGRYLITSAIPAKAQVKQWSPDGRRALIAGTEIQQVDLHTGQIVSGFSSKNYTLSFTGYTRPTGAAMLVTDFSNSQRPTLERVDPNGRVQQVYPSVVGGVGTVKAGPALYTAAGSAFVAYGDNQTMLMGNDAKPIRAYPTPAGYSQCQETAWWDADHFEEHCQLLGGRTALFLQDVDGGAPTTLTAAPGVNGLGYFEAFRLSNGDAMLPEEGNCGGSGYSILHPNGQISALRMPAGVPARSQVIAVAGDVYTFLVVDKAGCGMANKIHLVDYNMVTGQTGTITDTEGTIVGYPGSPRYFD